MKPRSPIVAIYLLTGLLLSLGISLASSSRDRLPAEQVHSNFAAKPQKPFLTTGGSYKFANTGNVIVSKQQSAGGKRLPTQGTTLNLSQDLVSLGIASNNMVPNQPALDAGPLFVAGVAYAKNHGVTTVVANPGAYYFLGLLEPNAHFALRN